MLSQLLRLSVISSWVIVMVAMITLSLGCENEGEANPRGGDALAAEIELRQGKYFNLINQGPRAWKRFEVSVNDRFTQQFLCKELCRQGQRVTILVSQLIDADANRLDLSKIMLTSIKVTAVLEDDTDAAFEKQYVPVVVYPASVSDEKKSPEE